MTPEELYDLKYTLAGYIYPMLKKFKEEVDNDDAAAVPDFFGDEISFEEKTLLWSKKLEEMIFPFEYHVAPKHFENLSKKEIDERMKNGLEVFAEHFKDLWY